MRSPRSRASSGEPRKRPGQRVHVSRWRAPDPVEQRTGVEPVDKLRGPLLVQGRQGETPVAERLDQYAAGGDQHQRAELGVMYDSERHLDAWLHHLLYRDGGAEARGHVPVSCGQDNFVSDTERHPAGFRLVGSCGRLQGDRVAEATGGSQDTFEIGRRNGTRHRNPVVCEHLQGAGLSEIFPRDQDFAPAPYGLSWHRVGRC